MHRGSNIDRHLESGTRFAGLGPGWPISPPSISTGFSSHGLVRRWVVTCADGGLKLPPFDWQANPNCRYLMSPSLSGSVRPKRSPKHLKPDSAAPLRYGELPLRSSAILVPRIARDQALSGCDVHSRTPSGRPPSGSNGVGNLCHCADSTDVGGKPSAPQAGFSSGSRKVFRTCRKMADGSDLPPKTPGGGVHP